MARADQIKALIKSHYLQDYDRFDTISLQLASHEARSGHQALALELKKLVDQSKKLKPQTDAKSGEIIFQNNSIDELYISNYSTLHIKDLIMKDGQKNKIEKILEEYYHQDKLKKFGMRNRRKILLSGQPGTGKTMTASVIASELNLPLHIIQLDKIITKYMGETSAKLRQIFKLIESRKGVYLFDEFDSIGTDRSKDNEVGEMRRVLNTLLQFLEGDNSNSLIVMATNNIKLLDKALFRRFDDILYYDLPSQQEITKLFQLKLKNFNIRFKFDTIADKAIGLCHADIVRICDDVMKESIINDKTTITKKFLLDSVENAKQSYERMNL